MSAAPLHGFFYTTKDREGEPVALTLPFSEGTEETIAWLMSQGRLHEVSGRRYRDSLSPLVAMDLPQGYFTWEGSSILFIYGPPVSDDGTLEEAENAGLHLIEFSPGCVRHAWLDEEEIGAQTSPDSLDALVRESREWESATEPDEREIPLDTNHQRLIHDNIAWLNDLITRTSQDTGTPSTRTEPELTVSEPAPKDAENSASEPEQTAASEAEPEEPAEDQADETAEAPFPEWAADQKVELAEAMLASIDAADNDYPVPVKEAIPQALANDETHTRTLCLLIRRILPMLLEDASAETMHDYFQGKLELSDQQYANLLKSNITVARFAAEVIVERTAREVALTRVSKMLKLDEDKAGALLDTSIEVIEDWPYGKLTASAKILNLAEEESKGCLSFLSLVLLTGALITTIAHV